MASEAAGEFLLTDAGDPHAERRRTLLAKYPEIRSLFGYDRRTAWATAAVVALQLCLAWIASKLASAPGAAHGVWVLVLGAYCIGAPLTHLLSTALHETSHRLAARTRRGNLAVALIANVPMVLPLAVTFHRYHLGHHRFLGVLDEDTDLPHRLEARYIGNSTIRKLVWVLLHPLVYLARGITYVKRPTVGEVANAIVIVAIDLAIVRLLGWRAFAYLALSFVFAHGLHPVAAHFIHDHYSARTEHETYSYYGPWNWLTFNLGYHAEHHDFMQVPGWRLPALHKIAPEYRGMIAAHRSCTRVLWRFITDPTLGYASRVVRTRETFERNKRRRLAHGTR